MTSLLSRALTPQTLRIPISEEPDTTRSSNDFPMNAAIASDLVLYSYMFQRPGNMPNVPVDTTLVKASSFKNDVNSPAARMSGILPPSNMSSEQEDRMWFLRYGGRQIQRLASTDEKNSSLRRWTMELSHVQISPTVWIDALTIEREMAFPRLQTSATKDNKTTYFTMMHNDMSRRFFLIPGSRSGKDTIDLYGLCASKSGADRLEASFDGDHVVLSRESKSNVSGLLFVSYGSRLVADTYIENATVKGTTVVTDTYSRVLVNLRDVLTMTVARLNWTPRDLAKVYNAKCTDSNGCRGVDVELDDINARLVLGASHLPTERATVPPDMSGIPRFAPTLRPVSLVAVIRPTTLFDSKTGWGSNDSTAFREIMMPHNIHNFTVSGPDVAATCQTASRQRMEIYVNDHVYIESTLQPTYTAAAFFFFQDAVRYNLITKPIDTTPMLAFPGNT